MVLKIGSYIITSISSQCTKYNMNIIQYNINSSFVLHGNACRILGNYLKEYC